MHPAPVLIASWARSAVVPRHGAFKDLLPHQIAAPVMLAALDRAGLSAEAVDTVILGNALGAGGNPARVAALHAGLPMHTRAFSIDTQCCAGLDAIALGASLIQSGQARVVVAGGVEAWSRSPLRMHRPVRAGEAPIAYERPAFAPQPDQDPDMVQAAADCAAQAGWTRAQQDRYAQASHQQAVAHVAELGSEIVPIAGVHHDPHPRLIADAKLARMPSVVPSMSRLAVSAQADGAACVVLLSASAAKHYGITPSLNWLGFASLGADPRAPMLAAALAAQAMLDQTHVPNASAIEHIELHDAFAAQGLSFCQTLGLSTEQINRKGGGLARGHPIGASGAVALVRVLSDLQHNARPGARGLACIAGAGGLGSAAMVGKPG
jgi:acetyl-CoA C-acetyltransferase